MAPKGYDRDRMHETVRERHGISREAVKKRNRRRHKKRRNRVLRRFGTVNWDVYQHDQLYDMIMSANPRVMEARTHQWRQLASSIESTTAEVQRTMQRLMTTWRGSSSVAMAQSSTQLMQWADDASLISNQIAAGMANYTEAVSRAQVHMPPPAFATAERNFREGYSVVGTGGPSTAVLIRELISDGMVSHEAARARKEEAVQVMKVYEDDSRNVHDTLPLYSDSPSVSGGGGSGAVTPSPGVSTPPGPAPGETPPPAPGAEVGTSVDDSTTTAGFTPSTAGIGPGGGVPGGVPGSAAGVGGFTGAPGAGADTVRGGGPLAGIGGVPGGAAGAAPRGGVAGGAGARGAGLGMFPGAAGAAGNDEDKEHTNKYDKGLDLFDDLPPAYPPVFGA